MTSTPTARADAGDSDAAKELGGLLTVRGDVDALTRALLAAIRRRRRFFDPVG